MQDPHHPDTHLETVHVTVSGKVQGVGYRHAMVRRAHLLERAAGCRTWRTARSRPWCRARPTRSTTCWNGCGAPAGRLGGREIVTRREYTDKRYIRFEQL